MNIILKRPISSSYFLAKIVCVLKLQRQMLPNKIATFFNLHEWVNYVFLTLVSPILIFLLLFYFYGANPFDVKFSFDNNIVAKHSIGEK
jgi:hypothetical protein